jgi:hypothetical protein
MNVAVGVVALVALALLHLAGLVGHQGWREWSYLSLSFVLLPWLLIGARLLSPALDRSFAVSAKEPQGEDESSPEDLPEGGAVELPRSSD